MKPEIEAILVLEGVCAPTKKGWATTWVAQDADGEWWAFNMKPMMRSGGYVWDTLGVPLARGCTDKEVVRMGTGTIPKDFTKMIFKL